MLKVVNVLRCRALPHLNLLGEMGSGRLVLVGATVSELTHRTGGGALGDGRHELEDGGGRGRREGEDGGEEGGRGRREGEEGEEGGRGRGGCISLTQSNQLSCLSSLVVERLASSESQV